MRQLVLVLQILKSLKKILLTYVLSRYDLFRNQKHKEAIQHAEKWLILETIDQAWKQHMLNLDHLKEGIGLRGWGQKTPLIEYKREAFEMFKEMMDQIRYDIVHHIFHLNVEHFDEHALEVRRQKELDEINIVSGEAEAQPKSSAREGDKVGRNDPCHVVQVKNIKNVMVVKMRASVTEALLYCV